MPECEFCGDEFSSKEAMQAHWLEEHEDELNSHQRDTAKKARKKLKRRRQASEEQKKKRMKQIGLYTIIAAVVIGIGFIAAQQIQVEDTGTPTGQSSAAAFQDMSGQPMLGDENASVTVVEFGDYRCPFCQRFEQSIVPQLRQEFVETGDVKFYFLNFAFLGPGSRQAAVAGECVLDQSEDEFWNFHEALYEEQGPESEQWVTKDLLMNVARDSTSGLDYDRLDACIANEETIDEVQQDMRIGENAGVSGTPAVYVNGRPVENWQYGNLRQVIQDALD